MADLGAIGFDRNPKYRNPDFTPLATARGVIRTVDLGSPMTRMCFGAWDPTAGFSSPPSLRIDGQGFWRFRWTVAAGSRSISIYTKQAANASPRPSVVVKANPFIGVNANVTGVAGSAVGFVQIGPISIVPIVAGYVWVELWNNLPAQVGSYPAYFDDIAVT